MFHRGGYEYPQMPGVRANSWLGMGTQLQRTVRRGALAACASRRALGQRRPRAYREVGVRIKGLTRIFSGSRASDTRGQASLPPRRRTPRPQPPVVSVFRRGGRRCGRLPTANRNLTAPNGNLTASKRGNCTIRGARTSSPHVESATKRENCTTRGSRSGLPADDTASKRGELHH